MNKALQQRLLLLKTDADEHFQSEHERITLLELQ